MHHVVKMSLETITLFKVFKLSPIDDKS